jgi:hypothetical protein
MNLDDLAKWAGVLAALISLAALLLSRRVHLEFGLGTGQSTDFDQGADEALETVNLSITNLGSRPVVLDMSTLQVRCNSNVLQVWRQDYFGNKQQEALLKPSESYAIGIPLGTFLHELKIKPPEPYDETSLYALNPVLVRVRTTDGRRHESKKLRFWEATGEFHRA